MSDKDSSLTLDFEATPREVVSSLMDGIEKYRRKKKTLRQIHAALSKDSSFSLSFSSFRNHYYQLRKERCNKIPSSISVSSNGCVSSSVVVAEPVPKSRRSDTGSHEKKSQGASQSIELSEDTGTAIKSADSKAAPPFKRIEIGGSMEEREAVARALFNQ